MGDTDKLLEPWEASVLSGSIRQGNRVLSPSAIAKERNALADEVRLLRAELRQSVSPEDHKMISGALKRERQARDQAAVRHREQIEACKAEADRIQATLTRRVEQAERERDELRAARQAKADVGGKCFTLAEWDAATEQYRRKIGELIEAREKAEDKNKALRAINADLASANDNLQKRAEQAEEYNHQVNVCADHVDEIVSGHQPCLVCQLQRAEARLERGIKETYNVSGEPRLEWDQGYTAAARYIRRALEGEQ